ncbi:MAG: proline racemase family protein [Clostridiales bacterium]|nr:proline racemase family protein [Clostridiales bacterium]
MWNIETIEVHTCGEPCRIIVNGLPELKGSTMHEKELYMKEHYDFIRTALLHEPRGHQNMFGAVVTKPCSENADFGVLFLNGVGYESMCGHGTICFCTVAINEKWITVTEPVTVLHIDTPSGLIPVHVTVKDGKAQEVTLQNVPAFVYSENNEVITNSHGTISVDVLFGGISFAHVNVDKLGIEITSENTDVLIDLAMDLQDNVNKYAEFHHPYLPIDTIDFIELCSEKTAGEKTVGRNCVIFGKKQIDRSPCGTGTSARLAYLYKNGRVGINEITYHENLLGIPFKGEITQEVKVGDFTAVVTKISGKAFITGRSNYIIDEEDPMAFGFLL